MTDQQKVGYRTHHYTDQGLETFMPEDLPVEFHIGTPEERTNFAKALTTRTEKVNGGLAYDIGEKMDPICKTCLNLDCARGDSLPQQDGSLERRKSILNKVKKAPEFKDAYERRRLAIEFRPDKNRQKQAQAEIWSIIDSIWSQENS